MKNGKYYTITISVLIGFLLGSNYRSKNAFDITHVSSTPELRKRPIQTSAQNASNIYAHQNTTTENYEELINTKTTYSRANSHGLARKDRWVEKNEKEYQQNLIDLGVPKEKISEIIGRRANLVELANVDKVFRQEMQKERLLYLQELKKSMTPEMYDIYEETEQIKGSEREIVKMEENGNTITAHLTPETQLKLKRMLVGQDMLTTESWDGPLDPLPNPLVGKVAVREHMYQNLVRLENNLPILISSMVEAGFENETIESVKRYYENEISALDRGYLSLLDENEISAKERLEKFNKQIEPHLQNLARQKETGQRVVNSFQNILSNKN